MNKILLLLLSIVFFEQNTFGESPAFFIEEKIQENKTIREFRDQNGRVFAIGWAGTVNLDSYQTILKYWRSSPLGEGQLDHKNIVVEKHGKKSFFWGRIYVPQYVPNGLDLKKIK